MTAKTYNRIRTQKELEEEEYRSNQAGGRRRCRNHPRQQMMPLTPRLDLCPICGGTNAVRP